MAGRVEAPNYGAQPGGQEGFVLAGTDHGHPVGDTLISMRTTLFAAALAITLSVNGQETSAVFDWDKLVVKKTATGERREIINRPTATMKNLESHATTLEAGLVPHAPHRHMDEEIVIVKEGTMEVTIEGKTQRGGPGSMFFIASNEMHGSKNVGAGRATYIVLRIVTEASSKH